MAGVCNASDYSLTASWLEPALLLHMQWKEWSRNAGWSRFLHSAISENNWCFVSKWLRMVSATCHHRESYTLLRIYVIFSNWIWHSIYRVPAPPKKNKLKPCIEINALFELNAMNDYASHYFIVFSKFDFNQCGHACTVQGYYNFLTDFAFKFKELSIANSN